MKKIIAILLVLAVCAGLCACGGKDVELPTKPVQAAVPDQSASVPQSNTDAAVESSEAIDPTGETYPWEAEFNGEDYVNFEFKAPNGDKIVTWREGSIFGIERRNLYEWAESGDIEDSYYYPSGNCSHSYMWSADGTYQENHYLDDGYTDLEKMMTYTGTTVYSKTIRPDGTWNETHCDENGKVTYSASLDANGAHWESWTLEDGTSRDVFDDPSTGYHSETEYYANGNIKNSVCKDADGSYSESEYYENSNIKKSAYTSSDGNYAEQRYYENGNMMYSKNQSPENTVEEHYDEEGFRTYFYSRNENWEIELISDETGKLVKVIENGTEIQNPAVISQYVKDYNFKE